MGLNLGITALGNGAGLLAEEPPLGWAGAKTTLSFAIRSFTEAPSPCCTRRLQACQAVATSGPTSASASPYASKKKAKSPSACRPLALAKQARPVWSWQKQGKLKKEAKQCYRWDTLTTGDSLLSFTQKGILPIKFVCESFKLFWLEPKVAWIREWCTAKWLTYTQTCPMHDMFIESLHVTLQGTSPSYPTKRVCRRKIIDSKSAKR